MKDTALQVRKSLKNLDLARIAQDLLVFGSETPENLDSLSQIRMIQKVKNRKIAGLGIFNTDVLLSDVAHYLEGGNFKNLRRDLGLTTKQCDAALRAITLIMLAFEKDLD